MVFWKKQDFSVLAKWLTEFVQPPAGNDIHSLTSVYCNIEDGIRKNFFVKSFSQISVLISAKEEKLP